jgi:hypothetical protein
MAMAMIVAAGCGKKSDSSDAASTEEGPGISAAEGNDLALTGQLAIGDLGLTAAEKGLLLFQFSQGTTLGDPTPVEVDAEGRFTVTIPKADEAVDFLVAQLQLDRSARDWAAMLEAVKKVLGSEVAELTVERLQGMTEDELNEGVGDLAESLKNAGRMTLLVAYDKSGDVKAEAQSFRFISMETAAGRNLSGFPNNSLKGNVNFGSITGSSADVKSEVKASDALDISAAAIENLADFSRLLKTVKNEYMNNKWAVEPFYFWRSGIANQNDVVDAWSDVNTSIYNGYGFYVPSNGDQGLSQADVCGGKTIELVPPSVLTLKDEWSTRTVTKFSNAGTSVGTGDTCNGGSDYYARQDKRNGDISYMLNFGTGGSIQESPEGLWSMKIDNVEVGSFDLATTMPIDVNKKPLVFLPQVKFNSSNGQIVSADVELYHWNGTAFAKVTDMDPVRRLFTDFQASVSNDASRADVTLQADGTLKAVFDSSESDNGKVLNPPVAVNSVTNGFAVYYRIGSNSYRMEYRTANN